MVEMLDCTLRDGGYYTNWDFSPELVDNYVDSMAKLPIDYIEFGYVNDDMDGYYGEYYFLQPDKLRQVKARLRADQKLVVMLDGKSGTVDRIDPLFTPLVGIVDGVRITAAPNALAHALDLARRLKALGFMVGFNVMYLSTYQDDITKLQVVIDEPESYDSIALVDSYGGCSPAKVARIIGELRAKLPNNAVGFHGHDNMCLAFANSLAAIEAGADIVDGTLTGMGRGAGNLRTEAMLIHLAREGTNRELDFQALASVVAPFEDMRKTYEWGTNLPYMLSGANNLPQKDVMDWLSKSRYSVVSIIRALQQQSGQEVDREVYPDVSQGGVDGRKVLLVGGGPSVLQHVDAIRAFVARHDPLVVFSSTRHLGLSDRIGGRGLLCLPGHDAFRADLGRSNAMLGAVVVAPPRVPDCVPAGLTLPVFQADAVSADGASGGPVSDSGPMALALGVAEALKAAQCWLVGFDGYDHASLAQQELAREVQSSLDLYAGRHGAASIVSLTPTLYRVSCKSIHGMAAAA